MGYTGSLEKMTVEAFQKSDFTGKVGTFQVYINPASYKQDYRICYSDTQAQGSNGGSPKFNRIGQDKISFDIVFDGTGVIPTAIPGLLPFTADGIVDQIKAFKTLVFSYNGNIHSPNYLKLAWGTLLFRCRMTSLGIKYTLFKPDGTPLRATASASFVGFNDEVELALKANKSSPDLSHLVTVKDGDTLPLMCFRIYGSSDYYLDVARTNGLTDVRRLAAGTQLLFPPLRSAV